MSDQDLQPADTLEDPEDRSSSKILLEAITEAQQVFRPYLERCKVIDEMYDRERRASAPLGFVDQDYDMFWSSMEIYKPAIYSRTPVPVASPMFEDRDTVVSTTADLLERALSSAFKRDDINQTMLEIRDDLAMANRGVMWVRYEAEDGQKVCFEWLDRTDFLHDPARTWRDVGWVARRGWMTLEQMKKRFKDVPGYVLARADFPSRQEARDQGAVDNSERAGVWEIWSRSDRKVYWVVEGIETVLDEREPHLDLSCFFPAPRPAYGTTKRRSLIPIPDWDRFSAVLEQINSLTLRIYELLDEVRLRGFYMKSGNMGDSINKLFNDRSSMMQLIGVDGGLMQSSAGQAIEWLPIDMISTTIQGLIAARQQLFEDFYQLSGISDIMRGATQADETLGAQRLKQSNGSVRVQDKQHELERIAADGAAIAAEIMAAKFNEKTLLEMSQMKIRKKAEIERDIKDANAAAKQELEALAVQAEEMAAEAQGAGQQVDPQQAEAQFNAAQHGIISKYKPKLDALGVEVSIDEVMKLLRDSKSRSFVIEIETDSTILQDETSAKQSANEFYSAFTGGVQGLAGMAAMGEKAVKLSAEVLRNTLAPYRPPRRLQSALDEFLDDAPEIASRMAAANTQGGEGDDVAALAEAEMEKAKAQMAKVEADSALKQAELQQRMTQMQIDTQEKKAKFQLEQGKLELAAVKQEQEFAAKMAEMDAKQNLMQAQTGEILSRIGLDARKQDLEEWQVATAAQQAQADTILAVEGMQQDAAFRAKEGQRADQSQQTDAEFRARGEARADRQQAVAETQPTGGLK